MAESLSVLRGFSSRMVENPRPPAAVGEKSFALGEMQSERGDRTLNCEET